MLLISAFSTRVTAIDSVMAVIDTTKASATPTDSVSKTRWSSAGSCEKCSPRMPLMMPMKVPTMPRPVRMPGRFRNRSRRSLE
jgi:hypothetical protein